MLLISRTIILLRRLETRYARETVFAVSFCVSIVLLFYPYKCLIFVSYIRCVLFYHARVLSWMLRGLPLTDDRRIPSFYGCFYTPEFLEVYMQMIAYTSLYKQTPCRSLQRRKIEAKFPGMDSIHNRLFFGDLRLRSWIPAIPILASTYRWISAADFEEF